MFDGGADRRSVTPFDAQAAGWQIKRQVALVTAITHALQVSFDFSGVHTGVRAGRKRSPPRTLQGMAWRRNHLQRAPAAVLIAQRCGRLQW